MSVKGIDRCLSRSADAGERAPPVDASRGTAKKDVNGYIEMCWRQVHKIQKTLCVVVVYFIVYLIVSFIIEPELQISFVSEKYRVGDKYTLIYLAESGSEAPVFSDAEGADVFAARQCGTCFITNNRGFLPITEYDAVLVLGTRSLLTEPAAFMDPEKRYLMEASRQCINNKLRGCMREPKITSFTTRKSYNLCTLCSELKAKRYHNYEGLRE